MLSKRVALAALPMIVVAGPGLAQEAELVANLNRTAVARGSGSETWVAAGGRLYFQRYRNRELELWRTDGTAADTRLVRELDARSVSTELSGGELADGRLIFSASDPALGRELWLSDGTQAGTELYADLCPGECDGEPGGSAPFGPGGDVGFVRFGSEVLFSAKVAFRAGDARLFAADGSPGGPRRVSDVGVRRWALAGDLIYILERPGVAEPWRLWVNRGSPETDRLVQELDVDFVWSFRALGDGVLAVVSAPGSEDFDVYSGGEEGLDLVATMSGEENREFRHAIAGEGLAYLSFAASGPCRLWRTDGTVAGTFELEAVGASGGNIGSCPRDVQTVGDRLFFDLETPEDGRELWSSDGTQAGTALVSDILPGVEESRPNRLTDAGARLVFFADGPRGPGLWSSDGTAAGTALVRTFEGVDEEHFVSQPLGVLDGRIFFAAADSGTGLEPWSSDGTAAGTSPLTSPGGDDGSSNPSAFLRRADELFFVAGSGAGGFELFRIDTAGAVDPVFVSGNPQASVLGTAGDRILVQTLADPRLGPTRLLAVDPATGAAPEILEVPRVFEAEAVGDELFLISGRQISSGGIRSHDDLWVTDGTAAGTARLAHAEEESTIAFLDLTAWRGRLYFSHTTAAAGSELWRSDGTPGGTRLALDLRRGAASSGPDLLAATGDRLYLRASLDESTRPLLELDGRLSVRRSVDVGDFPQGSVTVLRDRVLWIAGSFAAGGPFELWASDLTGAGTLRLGRFDDVGPLVPSGGRIFFRGGTAEDGQELWATDGTPGGTRLVRDLEPGPASSEPASLADVAGTLLFAARTSATGSELWASDGTADGTRLVADVAPGPESSRPANFELLGERVVFAAYRSDVGRELFAVPRSSVNVPCTPGEHTLCLSDGRFAVEADWEDFAGASGRGRAFALTSDTGYFWFFSPDNVEVVVKVLDGCALSDRFWVFAGGLTNVRVTLTVTDRETGVRRTYTNPLGAPFQPIQDTSAFATCP